MVEYIKALWGWPTVTLILVMCFRKEIRQVVDLIYKRGIEANLAKGFFKIPPLTVEEHRGESGARVGSVTTQVPTAPKLTEFQMKILQEFIKRGDYDTLDVSKTLIGDFRYLRMYGLLTWEREQDKEDQISLTKFALTEEGKKNV